MHSPVRQPNSFVCSKREMGNRPNVGKSKFIMRVHMRNEILQHSNKCDGNISNFRFFDFRANCGCGSLIFACIDHQKLQ